MFIVVTDIGSNNLEEDSLLLAKLREMNFEHSVVNLEQLVAEDKLEELVGVVFTDSIDDADGANLDSLLASEVPMLGIGAGGRFLFKAYGGQLKVRDAQLGKKTKFAFKNQCVLFDYLPMTLEILDPVTSVFSDVPEQFEVVAESEDGSVRGIQHLHQQLFVVDFPLESTGDIGRRILDNFLRYAGTFSGAL